MKTIATATKQFRKLMDNPDSSLSWLMMRTQAIGDAAETDPMIKFQLQRYKMLIKEVYHRKFVWNNTKLGIDGRSTFES